MLNKDKKLKKVVNSTVSGATLEMIDELDKNNVSLEEFSGGDFFKLSDEEKVPLRKDINSINEKDLKNVAKKIILNKKYIYSLIEPQS